MKNNKFNALAFVAMLATAGAAYALSPETTQAQQNEHMWARNADGEWRNLTLLGQENAQCIDAPEACKLTYLEGFTPETGDPTEPGYVDESLETGFVNIP